MVSILKSPDSEWTGRCRADVSPESGSVDAVSPEVGSVDAVSPAEGSVDPVSPEEGSVNEPSSTEECAPDLSQMILN